MTAPSPHTSHTSIAELPISRSRSRPGPAVLEMRFCQEIRTAANRRSLRRERNAALRVSHSEARTSRGRLQHQARHHPPSRLVAPAHSSVPSFHWQSASIQPIPVDSMRFSDIAIQTASRLRSRWDLSTSLHRELKTGHSQRASSPVLFPERSPFQPPHHLSGESPVAPLP